MRRALSGFDPDADIVECAFKRGEAGIKAVGFDRVKAGAQGFFLVAFAIVPWPTLKAHDQNVIAYEMWFCTCAQHLAIGRIGAKAAQGFGIWNASSGASGVHGGAEVADG